MTAKGQAGQRDHRIARREPCNPGAHGQHPPGTIAAQHRPPRAAQTKGQPPRQTKTTRQILRADPAVGGGNRAGLDPDDHLTRPRHRRRQSAKPDDLGPAIAGANCGLHPVSCRGSWPQMTPCTPPTSIGLAVQIRRIAPGFMPLGPFVSRHDLRLCQKGDTTCLTPAPRTPAPPASAF